MATYFISYDLCKEEDSSGYALLKNELEKMGAKRVLLSEWYLDKYGTNCKEIGDYLVKFIDDNDRLLIVKSDGWAACNLLSDPNE